MSSQTPNCPLFPVEKTISLETSGISDQPDEKYEEEKDELDTQKLEEEISSLAATRELREFYAKRIFRFLCGWSLFVALILIFSGFSSWGFKLSDTVLSVLTGSTTVSVLGLVVIILKGLFPKQKI